MWLISACVESLVSKYYIVKLKQEFLGLKLKILAWRLKVRRNVLAHDFQAMPRMPFCENIWSPF